MSSCNTRQDNGYGMRSIASIIIVDKQTSPWQLEISVLYARYIQPCTNRHLYLTRIFLIKPYESVYAIL
jgi:hypothetical protein